MLCFPGKEGKQSKAGAWQAVLRETLRFEGLPGSKQKDTHQVDSSNQCREHAQGGMPPLKGFFSALGGAEMADIVSFSEFTRDVLSCVNRGYYYFHISRIPRHKLDRAPKIHAKLMSRYPVFWKRAGKYHRHMRKKKGLRNYLLKTYEDIIVLLHTPGEADIAEKDAFTDIRLGSAHALVLRYPGDDVVLGYRLVWNENRGDVYLTNECYKYWRSAIEEALSRHWDIEPYLKILELLPGFRGVNQQLNIRLRMHIREKFKVRLRELKLRPLKGITAQASKRRRNVLRPYVGSQS